MSPPSAPRLRPRLTLHRWLLTPACLLLVASTTTVAAQDSYDRVTRVVAVGDVHGGFDQLVTVLRSAGVIDRRNRWSGGATHLVQTGDVLDRGPASRKVMDLLMELEKQAARAGGRVHALIGNHEVMNVVGDLRYVSEAEYEAFRTRDSVSLRDRAFELLADPAQKEIAGYREGWDKEHPLGWIEHRQAFGPNGKYGKWIRQHNAVIRVGDLLLLHGGLSPKVADMSLTQINDRIRQELADLELIDGGLAVDEQGPLWYRGLAQAPEAELLEHVDRLLARHKVRHIVVGHSIGGAGTPPAVQREGDHDRRGPVLVLRRAAGVPGRRGRALVHAPPRRACGAALDGNLRPYVEKLAALDPPPSPLLKILDQLAPMVR